MSHLHDWFSLWADTSSASSTCREAMSVKQRKVAEKFILYLNIFRSSENKNEILDLKIFYNHPKALVSRPKLLQKLRVGLKNSS